MGINMRSKGNKVHVDRHNVLHGPINYITKGSIGSEWFSIWLRKGKHTSRVSYMVERTSYVRDKYKGDSPFITILNKVIYTGNSYDDALEVLANTVMALEVEENTTQLKE